MSSSFKDFNRATLDELSIAERQAALSAVFTKMADGTSPAANKAFAHLVGSFKPESPHYLDQDYVPSTVFAKEKVQWGIDLVMSMARVKGYLNAIRNEPSPGRAIDAGSGSTALLGLGIRIFHPSVEEVLCIEIDPDAADVSRELLAYTGFNDRVQVLTANVMRTNVGRADLGVTETFDTALKYERGYEIANRLGLTCARILPRYARIHVSEDRDTAGGWQVASLIDFKQPVQDVKGRFTRYDPDSSALFAWSELLNEEGVPLIKLDEDSVSYASQVCEISRAIAVGSVAEFSYPSGRMLGLPGKVKAL